MQPHAAATSSQPLGPDLDQHHRHLEEACLGLLAAGLAGVPHEMARRWSAIECKLLDHLMAEEQFLFPAFSQAEPEIAHDLRKQHETLRERAFEIGVAIQLHMLRSAQIRTFIDLLRDHRSRESGTIYRWAEGHVARDQLRQLRAWLAATV